MKCVIESANKQIMVAVDLRNPVDLGEVAHFIAELELIKQQLIVTYDKLKQGV